jgi:sulfonate transport system ATP-binding protein
VGFAWIRVLLHEHPISNGERWQSLRVLSRPRLLLLDEPFGALDALTRFEMQRLLERIWLRDSFTAVLVTHDVQEAVALSDRVVVLDRGGVALDVGVAEPRPRNREHPALVALVIRVLGRLVGE